MPAHAGFGTLAYVWVLLIPRHESAPGVHQRPALVKRSPFSNGLGTVSEPSRCARACSAMRGSHEVMRPRSLSTFPSRPLALAPVWTLPDVELPMLGVEDGTFRTAFRTGGKHEPGLLPRSGAVPVSGLKLVRRFQLRLAVGKAKAHFEFRSLDHDPAAVYGGEPCKTTHVVTARLEVCYQPLGAVDRAEASPSKGPA